METEVDFSHTKLYALSSRLLKKGIPASEPPEMKAYRANSRAENFRNLVYWIVHRELDSSVKFQPPVTLPETGVTHPDCDAVCRSIPEFQAKFDRFRPVVRGNRGFSGIRFGFGTFRRGIPASETPGENPF